MMIKKNKDSFLINFDTDFESDSDYEEGDCFDLDDEWKPIPKVFKKKLCDKTRITNYILFTSFITIFGYILYTTINEVYK